MSPPAQPRVVITGRGAVTPLGPDVSSTEASLREGRSAIAPLEREGRPVGIRVGAVVPDFEPAAHFPARRLPQLDIFSQLAVVAARQAVAEAGLPGPLDAARIGVILGTGTGGMTTVDAMSYRVLVRGKERTHPMTVPRFMPNAAVSQVSIELGFRGPSFAVTSACASSNHAIGIGLQLLRMGQLDCAIVGGSEACFNDFILTAWDSLPMMAPDTCRPFSRDRKGMVLGEGAGVFVLERLDDARRRGATAFAELAGFGMSADADDLLHPAVEGMAAAMGGALRDAGLEASQVDYVNAHGTGTVVNDVAETRALHQVFGDDAGRLAISSTKSLHGHALGAAGALELLAVVLALREGVIPPTANHLGSDPECDLDYTPNTPASRKVHAALSNAFAFGGLNAVLALIAADEPPAAR